ncbi:MAG: L,D-transpeptidase family protein [Phycisphaerae bacterium]|nr:L,D-transpeptidase family protein [Phycisphaerae bacterium]
MTAREYRPYPTRKQQKDRTFRIIAIALIVLIAAAVIFIQQWKNKQPHSVPDEVQKVSLDNVLPAKPAAAPAEPQRVLNPSVALKTESVPPAVPSPTPAEPAKTAVSGTAVPTESVKPAEPAAVPKPAETVTTVQIPQDVLTAASADTGQTSEKAKEIIKQATELRDAGKVISARDLLNDALNMQLSPVIRSAVKLELSKLAQKWLFSPQIFPDDKLTGQYLVQPGDLLQDIARDHKVPFEILMEINGISRPELLQAGKKIKVINGPFNVVVYKKSFTMDLYLQNKYIKTYRVGLGKEEHETPAGRWRVAKGGKLIKPTWTDPDTGKRYLGTDPDYPLGSRWIAIEGIDENTRNRTGFAIHGTKEPETIGTRSSRGCIRLHNGEVIEVYNLLYPGISEVLIEE